jgi:OFA family oxalate/formate antiporter-like MFS transporter
MSAVSIFACLGFLRAATGFWGVVAGLCLAAFAYGGYLALMPTFSADFFGQAHVGGNYGLLFSAWGVCGFVFPLYSESLLDRFREAGNLAGGYKDLYSQLALLAVGVAVLGAILKSPKIKRI